MLEAKIPRIINGDRNYVTIKDKNEEISFEFPYYGPQPYGLVALTMRSRQAIFPTGNQIVSLLHELYTSNDKEIIESRESLAVKYVMDKKYYWIHNKCLWMPLFSKNAGVYVKHDCNGLGMEMFLDINSLEDELSGGTTEKGIRFSKDRKTSFAPYSTIEYNVQPAKNLSNNGFVISNFDFDGAEKLSRISASVNQSKAFLILGDDLELGTPVEGESITVIYREFQTAQGNLVIGSNKRFNAGKNGYSHGIIKKDEIDLMEQDFSE